MAVTLPRLGTSLGAIVDSGGVASTIFSRFWDTAMSAVEEALSALQDQEEQLAAQEQQSADTLALLQRAVQAISQPVGLAISAGANTSDTTVTIGAHTRVYLDKAAVAVNAGTVTGVPFGSDVFLYYDDPDRAGGAVTYHWTTDPSQAVASYANINRHYLGDVVTPASAAAAPSTGTGATPPGQRPRPGTATP